MSAIMLCFVYRVSFDITGLKKLEKLYLKDNLMSEFDLELLGNISVLYTDGSLSVVELSGQ